MDMKILEIN